MSDLNKTRELEEFVFNLYEKWKNRPIGLGTPLSTESKKLIQKRATETEKNILKILEKNNEKWSFVLTPYSKTPADIVGYKETDKSIYFLLSQVKSGKLANLRRKKEKKDVPNFKDCLYSLLNEEQKNKTIIIAYNYVLVPNNEKGFKKRKSIDDIIYTQSDSYNRNVLTHHKTAIKKVFISFERFTKLETEIKNKNYNSKS